jgi:hypothetical protein
LRLRRSSGEATFVLVAVPGWDQAAGWHGAGVDLSVAGAAVVAEAQAIWLNDSSRTITGRGGVKSRSDIVAALRLIDRCPTTVVMSAHGPTSLPEFAKAPRWNNGHRSGESDILGPVGGSPQHFQRHAKKKKRKTENCARRSNA